MEPAEKIKSGLNEAEIAESIRRFGKNIRAEKKSAVWNILKGVLTEPMLVLLIVTCAFYFFMNNPQEGIIMAVAIIAVSGISIFQQFRSENAIRELNRLTAQQATVIRSGKIISIPSEEVVIGDIMMAGEGERVVADALLLTVADLSVDESLLTGESLPVTGKRPDAEIYSGTTILSGSCIAEVHAIGMNTRIGKMGKLMEETKGGKTPLQIQVNRFVNRMAMFGIFAFVIVWLFNFIESHDIMHSLMHGLTLAMAVLPEEIPVALATFMALGAYRMIRRGVLARHPQTVEALGAATVICVDKTGTVTQNRMVVDGLYVHATNSFDAHTGGTCPPGSERLLWLAFLASETHPFDPMEKAIHEAYQSCSDKYEITSVIHEYPLSGKHPMMTHVHGLPDGTRIIAVKGAPEGIIEQSDLDQTSKSEIRNIIEQFAGKGQRVLAIGEAICEGELPEQQEMLRFRLAGLVALSDPPKLNIRSVIEGFHTSGIAVKMITGDHPQTAVTIAAEIGMRGHSKCITGLELEAMDDAAFAKAVQHHHVFARIMPEQKLRIIQQLQSDGEVVAMTGDGVNDGPALKAADIGISMGKHGSEVARQASSLVLMEDDLGAMVKAVELGRIIYSNLKKAIRYIIAIHIPLISIVTIPLLLGWKFPNVFSPVHIIFLELIMGPTCSIVFENEPAEKGIMQRPQKRSGRSLFTWHELAGSVIQGLAITTALLVLMLSLSNSGSGETEIRTMVFSALVISNILLTFSGRSATESIFNTIRYKNVLVPVATVATLGILTAIIYIPASATLFGFMPLTGFQFFLCIVTALAPLALSEIMKLFRKV